VARKERKKEKRQWDHSGNTKDAQNLDFSVANGQNDNTAENEEGLQHLVCTL
jgi:hypothetical protein